MSFIWAELTPVIQNCYWYRNILPCRRWLRIYIISPPRLRTIIGIAYLAPLTSILSYYLSQLVENWELIYKHPESYLHSTTVVNYLSHQTFPFVSTRFWWVRLLGKWMIRMERLRHIQQIINKWSIFEISIQLDFEYPQVTTLPKAVSTVKIKF